MTNATAKQSSTSTPAGEQSPPPAKRRKFDAYLVTLDDELWPQVGSHLTERLNHRQIDSIEELVSATGPGEAAIILWDARGAADQADILVRLAAHSPRFAVIALDIAESASGWAPEVERGQIVAHVAVPFDAERMASALAGAYDEASARLALLGEATAHEGAAHVTAKAVVPAAALRRSPFSTTESPSPAVRRTGRAIGSDSASSSRAAR